MKKNFLILFGLILFIVSIAGVSATEDVNQTITDDTNNVVSSGDTLSVSQSDDEIIGSADNGTFTALQKKINEASVGSIINLENNYTFDGYNDANIISINKSLVINGNGFIIDCSKKNVAFNILSDNVILDNITFINNYYESYRIYYYDFIKWEGKNGFLKNSNFFNNHIIISTLEFSLINWIGNNGCVFNCSFKNNTVASGSGIRFRGNDYQISDSIFKNNILYGSSWASVIYADECNSLLIDSCIFVNNSVEDADIKGSIINCSILNSNFTGNTGCGIHIYNYNMFINITPKIYLSNCNFYNNNYSGKAVNIHECDAIINNSTFINNSNGAIATTSFTNNCSVNISNCLFFKNIVKDEHKYYIITGGGALDNSGCFVNIFNSDFISNSGAYGGAIISDSHGNIINSTFKNNIATLEGGAFYSSFSTTHYNFINSTFLNNDVIGYAYREKHGGAIMLKANNGFIQNCLFINNTLNNDESIYISDFDGFNFSIYNSNNINNSYGGAISITNNTLIVHTTYSHIPPFEGNVTLIISNKTYKASTQLGYAYFNLGDIPPSVYDAKISIEYNNYDGYHYSEINIPITIILNYMLFAPDVVKYYHGPERFVVTVKDRQNNPVVDGEVTITLNGVPYNRTTDANGQASMAINLISGVHQVTSEFGDIKVQSTVTVKPTISGNNVTKIYRNDTQYYATFKDSNGNLLRNTDVNFNINGVFYTRKTNDAGVARMNINLLPGEYIITAYNPSSTEQSGNLIKVLPSIITYDLTKYYKNASALTFRLLNNQGRPVGAGVSATININGVFYTRQTNASGYVNMNINLIPGTYIATLNYNGLMASSTVKILPILEAKDVVMKYRDGTKFEAKLLDGQGKPFANQTLIFNINGVMYNRITDGSGIARLNINLMPGEYIITSMYENGATIANKVTIRS